MRRVVVVVVIVAVVSFVVVVVVAAGFVVVEDCCYFGVGLHFVVVVVAGDSGEVGFRNQNLLPRCVITQATALAVSCICYYDVIVVAVLPDDDVLVAF